MHLRLSKRASHPTHIAWYGPSPSGDHQGGCVERVVVQDSGEIWTEPEMSVPKRVGRRLWMCKLRIQAGQPTRYRKKRHPSHLCEQKMGRFMNLLLLSGPLLLTLPARKRNPPPPS